MSKFLTTIFFSLFVLNGFGQNQMRSVEQLINTTDPGWSLVKKWIKNAKNKVEVLPADSVKAKEALYHTQVTTRSPMGAIVYMTGGILIDHGWIRILGSGSSKLNRSLPEWNKGKAFENFGTLPAFLIVADDVLGGLFLLNGGGLGEDLGNVYYFSPDNLDYEPLNLTYSDFLQFCFNGDFEKFYETFRWQNWKNDIVLLNPDNVYTFFPYLWTKEGKDIHKLSRNEISAEEQYYFNLDFMKKLGLDK